MKALWISCMLIISLGQPAFAAKHRASKQERQDYANEYLQSALNEFMNLWRFDPAYLVIGDVKLVYNPLLRGLDLMVEPFMDHATNGAFNNQHRHSLTYLAIFTVQDQQGECHRGKLYLREDRYGKESKSYNRQFNVLKDYEKIIPLDNEAISVLTFQERYDSNPLVKNEILTERNIVCPGEERISESDLQKELPARAPGVIESSVETI